MINHEKHLLYKYTYSLQSLKVENVKKINNHSKFNEFYY